MIALHWHPDTSKIELPKRYLRGRPLGELEGFAVHLRGAATPSGKVARFKRGSLPESGSTPLVKSSSITLAISR